MLLKKMFIVLPMMKTKIVMFNDAINQIAFPALVLISTLLAAWSQVVLFSFTHKKVLLELHSVQVDWFPFSVYVLPTQGTHFQQLWKVLFTTVLYPEKIPIITDVGDASI